jgi:starch phosphorylase
MSELTPNFSACRAVKQYVKRYYAPAAIAYANRTRDGGRLAAGIVAWQRRVEKGWHLIRIISREATCDDRPGGKDVFRISTRIELGDLLPDDVLVEIFADNHNSAAPLRQILELQRNAPESSSAYIYSGEVPSDRPESHYTIRVVPYYPQVQVPLECSLVCWEK